MLLLTPGRHVVAEARPRGQRTGLRIPSSGLTLLADCGKTTGGERARCDVQPTRYQNHMRAHCRVDLLISREFGGMLKM